MMNKHVKDSIKLLGYNCQICGSNKKVYTHHLDGDHKNNNPNNWQRLCPKCHRKTFQVKYPIPRLTKDQKYQREQKRYYISIPEAIRQLNLFPHELNQLIHNRKLSTIDQNGSLMIIKNSRYYYQLFKYFVIKRKFRSFNENK